MHKTLFLIALSFLQIQTQLELCKGAPLPVPEMAVKAGNNSTEEMEMMGSESNNRRVLYVQRTYISYATLRRDMVPCDKPGASYYNCRASGAANSYTRGCESITRCARGD